MKQRRKNAFFQDLLEAGSRTTYHGKIRGRSSGRPRATVSRGKQRTYKGVQIIPLGGGEYTISIDRDSRFENVRDAKKVIDHMRGNPTKTMTRTYFANKRERDAFVRSEKRKHRAAWGGVDGSGYYVEHWVESNPRGSKGKFQRCVESVAARGGAYDPRAVCGAMEKKYRKNRVGFGSAPYRGAYTLDAQVDALNEKITKAIRKGTAASLRQAQALRAKKDELLRRVSMETRTKNPAAGAIAVSEEFHGRKVKQMVPVQETRHYHKYLADLGELRKLVVLTRDGKGKVTLTGFKGAMLTCNEAKDQLFITGGDQTVNPKDFGIDHPHEVETLGEVVTIEYFTDKHHLGSEGGTATYTHKFRSTNENGKHVTVRTARNPDLIYHKRDKHLEFSGGSYLIRKEGIDL